MARVNVGSTAYAGQTHEGAPARALTPEQELRRSVLACLLWEDGFYESGKTIADRIAALVPQVPAEKVAALAVEARSAMHLRHAPLFLVREMARHASHRPFVRATLAAVIQRADELAEFLALYWKPKKQSLAKSVQRGLADAFARRAKSSNHRVVQRCETATHQAAVLDSVSFSHSAGEDSTASSLNAAL